ncbi:MAG: M24 family metallopeptidase [Candidatus Thorarchaeota archaeon]|jgi:Xaa-Pro aminopeptidase
MIDDLDTLMERDGIDSLLAVGSAFEVPSIYWLTGFRSPDNIIYFRNINEEPVVAAALKTLERVEKESFIKKTHDLSDTLRKLRSENKSIQANWDLVYGPILKELFTGKIIGVPDSVPASIVEAIQGLGYKVKAVNELIEDARATKTSKEIEVIKSAGDATVGALSQAIEMIKDSEIGSNNNLVHKGKQLTVGDLKLALEHFLIDRGAESAEDAIVAVGTKGFDWHYLGDPDDKLKANVPIIIDVFPRLKIARYVADVTRTVVKGKVSKEVRQMFDAVQNAAVTCIDTLKDGALIDDVNMACFQTLKHHGYDSTKLNPLTKEGMTHGLGHGIGLEVHENPSMYIGDNRFEAGNVMAIEPGVYTKAMGGVRIENDYVVTKGKAKRLTTGIDDILFV